MACTNVEQLFVEHAGRIRNDVSKQIQVSDFYLKNMPRDQWLNGQGTQYSYPIYERVLPSSPVSFTNWSSSVGDGDLSTDDGDPGGSCALTGVNIDSFGQTTRQTVLKRAAINSPDICLDDLQFAWQVDDQIKNVVRVFSEISKYVWVNAYQDEYIAATGNKLIADASVTAGTTSFPLVAPTSKLTWGYLEHIYEQLGYNGGGINPFMRVDEMTPIYALVGDRFTFEDLKRQDANTRSDFHYSSQADAMLAAPGLNGVYRGYKFFTVEFPPRWDFVGGAWVRRQPYAAQAATLGQKQEVSDLYKNAQFTDTAVFLKDVMEVLIPRPNGADGKGGMKYNPKYSWSGEFQWRNIPSRDCNPDGNIGFFRALYAYGVKIHRPDLGFVIRHQRCTRAIDALACGY